MGHLISERQSGKCFWQNCCDDMFDVWEFDNKFTSKKMVHIKMLEFTFKTHLYARNFECSLWAAFKKSIDEAAGLADENGKIALALISKNRKGRPLEIPFTEKCYLTTEFVIKTIREIFSASCVKKFVADEMFGLKIEITVVNQSR